MPSTTMNELQPGALVAVRGQKWVISEIDPAEGSTLVALQSVEDGRYGDTLEVIWRSSRVGRYYSADRCPPSPARASTRRSSSPPSSTRCAGRR